MMCRFEEPHPLVSTLIQAEIFWMGKEPMVFDKEYKLKIATAKVSVRLKKIKKIIDAAELKKSEKDLIERHDVAQCLLGCSSPIAFDLAGLIPATARFVIVDKYDIAGGGIISAIIEDEQANVREQVQLRELKWDFSIVDPKHREAKYGHGPKLIL
jgi:bifunctional enzyme CysN/CysC